MLDQAYKIALAQLKIVPRIEVIIFNRDEKVLVGKNPRNGHYMFPGGHIESGETPLKAARREIREEAGLGISNPRLIGYEPYVNIKNNTTTIFATARTHGEKETASDDFLLDIQFLSIEEAEKIFRKNSINPDYQGITDARIEAMKMANNELSKEAEWIDPAEELGELPPATVSREPLDFFIDGDEEESLADELTKSSAVALVERNSYSRMTKEGALVATVGQIMANKVLPNDLRDYNRVLTKKTITQILQKIAGKYPDKYVSISDTLRSLGDNESIFSLRHLKYEDGVSPIDPTPYLDRAKKDYEKLKKEYKNDNYALADAYSSAKERLTNDTIATGLKNDNLFTVMSSSGARGSPAQVTDLITAPLLVSDYKNKPIPVILNKSYAEGLTPAQYFAASYGTRRGMISVKMATPLGGYMSKKLGWSMSPVVVTEPDCGTKNGVSYSLEDKWNVGKYLAVQAGNYKKDTFLEPSVIEDLKHQGIKDIQVRSPITCESREGICQKCLGKTEMGKISPLGYNAGINSSAGVTEPITQSLISEKHTGGAIKKRIGGFEEVSHLVSIPEIFPGKAILARDHGTITDIQKNSWGGWKIFIGTTEHTTSEDNPPIVKVGDVVEKGDRLTDGILNPAEVTQYKGYGEGRKSLTNELTKTYEAMNIPMDRSHFEVLSRALINFAEAEKPIGNFLPGEVGRIDDIKKDVEFHDVKEVATSSVIPFNIYLAKQVMHYMPGVEITEKVKKDLVNHGHGKIMVTTEKPAFYPLMVRAEDTAQYNTDWIERLGGQNLSKSLLEALHRGRSSSTESKTNFIHPFIHGITLGKRNIY